jgi:hypothetical protein
MRVVALAIATWALLSPRAYADNIAELAQQLANPISSLISVPFQYNYDQHIGSVEGGHSNYVNFQPVIPFRLDHDWNLISRTVVPIIDQHEIFPGAGDQFGLADTIQSFFLSPEAKGPGGLIWGAGPAVNIPSTNELLGVQKWGLGPTAVVLVQPGQWTIGILTRHIWSIGGSSTEPDINDTYLQPFVAYTTKDAWTFTLNSETNYYWNNNEWSVPVHAQLTKLFKIGDQPISMGPAVRYWAVSPDSGPHDLAFRFSTTFLFPTGNK